jgi:hypothetical protein
VNKKKILVRWQGRRRTEMGRALIRNPHRQEFSPKKKCKIRSSKYMYMYTLVEKQCLTKKKF